MTDIKNTILYFNSNGEDFTIEDYEKAISDKNKEILANFIYDRLYSRYIRPFEYCSCEYKTHYKNGFAMMASFCLLIETIQSFKEGIGDSSNINNSDLFKRFFNNKDIKKIFKENEWISEKFYKNVRCGILHQGETTGGWKINRKKNTMLLDKKNINANEFMNKMKKVLENYKKELEVAYWESETWLFFKYKMNYIINNCK